MKKHYWCVLVFLLVSLYSIAQTAPNSNFIDTVAVDTVDSINLEEEDPSKFYLAMDYGQAAINEIPVDLDLRKRNIQKIELVYSNFPKGSWNGQKAINYARIQNLFARIPEAEKVLPQNWQVVMQDGATNLNEAKTLFHGFVIYTKQKFETPPDLPNFLDESGLYFITRGDSTVHKIFERNQDWKKMLVVTDLTGSMAPFTAQLLLWLKLNQVQRTVNYFVFFNDGDLKLEEDKIIGATGGIYGSTAETFMDVAALAQETVMNGSGGDYMENDLESVLNGIDACPDCEDVILIADNRASPRDMALLNQIQKPVRIILCGTNEGVNVDYLNIALRTNGSIHTIEQDLVNLVRLNEGTSINLGKEVFVIKNGKIEYLKKL